jgi:hypothetical protein
MYWIEKPTTLDGVVGSKLNVVYKFPNKKLRAYGGCLDSKEVMKDAHGGDTPRGGAYGPLIRGCPNGETHSGESRSTLRIT